jgi:HAD superfamily hydrolase (TIGR01509 family)
MQEKNNGKQIKNIIFDLGNVICDIDFDRTVKAFNDLSETSLSISVEDYIHHPIFGGLEKGKLSTSQFRDEIRELLNTEVSDAAIDKAWAAVIINSDQERMDMLKSLSKEFRIFLLSNTNEIHINAATKIFKDSFDVDFLGIFEKTYLSHEVGMAKPNASIFTHVLEDANLVPEETFFVDDNLPNIEAAKKLGIQSHHFNPQAEKLPTLFLDF